MTHIKWLILVATPFAALAACVHAGPAEDQFKVGVAHYLENRWRLATDEFEVFLEQFPRHPKRAEAEFRSAEALVQLGQYAAADEHYRHYLESYPEGKTANIFAVKALFRRGEIAYYAGQPELARQRLTRFRSQFPHDPHNEFALVYLGDLALADGDAIEAQKWFAQVASDYPNGALAADADFGHARALDSLGHQDEALAKYRELAGREGRVGRQAHLQLALDAYRQRDFVEAETQLAPFRDDKVQDDVRTQALYWLGMSQLAQQQWSAAAQTLSDAVSDNPKHALAPRLHFHAGGAYRRAAQPNEARAHFDVILAKWPDSEFADDVLFAQARLALDLGDLPRVHELAQRFAAQYPNSGRQDEVRELAARALLAQGQYREADALFQGWLQTSDRLPNNTTWYLYSLAQLGTDQHGAALASLDRIELPSDDSALHRGILVARASSLMGMERYNEAIVPLQDYLASQPDGADQAKCQSDLAMCMAKTGRLDEAAKWWNRFHQANNDHPQSLPIAHFLAETAYDQGDRAWATELFTFLAEENNPAEYIQFGIAGLIWCQQGTGGVDESTATFERLWNQSPDPITALMQARRLEREDRFDGALATYQLIIDQFPTSRQMPDALFAAARIHDRLEQDADALRLLNQLLADYPGFRHRDVALYVMAWIQSDLGQQSQSAAAFQKIHDEYVDSLYWPDATYRLAEQAVEAQDFLSAQQLCRAVTDQGCETDLLGYVLYLQGRAAALAGEWSDVAPPLERLIKELTDHELNFVADYWIAESLYRQRMYDEAGQRFAVLAKTVDNGRDNNNAAPWTAVIPLRQAQVLAQQRHWSDALDIARQVVDRFPEFRQLYEAHYLIGRCLAADGQFEAARQSYEQVLSSPAGSQSVTAAIAQWMIGETYLHQKKYNESIRAYLRVEILYEFPRWRAHALLQAGKCYEMKNVWSEAIRLYARILKEFPDSAVADKASERLRLASRQQP